MPYGSKGSNMDESRYRWENLTKLGVSRTKELKVTNHPKPQTPDRPHSPVGNPSPGQCYIQQVPICDVHLLQVGFIGHALNSLLLRHHLIVTGHYHYSPEL